MYIKSIRIKRNKNSNWEPAFSIESSGTANDYIIDKDGNIIIPNSEHPLIYDAQDYPALLIDLHAISKNM